MVDPDAYPIIFKRALSQYLAYLDVGVYRANGSNYTPTERGIYPKGVLPTYPGTDNCIVPKWLTPIADGRSNMIYRVQIFSRVKGDSTAAENLAGLIARTLDHKADVPPGFNVAWCELFSELPFSADSSGRCATAQTFTFMGRRPQ